MDLLHGTVAVTVGDKTYTLKPTLEAALKIEARFGGLRGALNALNALTIEGASFVIAAGARLKDDEVKGLAERVFQSGITGITAQVVPYVSALLNPTQGRGDSSGNAEAANTAQ